MASLKIVLTLFLYNFCKAAVVPELTPDQQNAMIARYIIHNTDWLSIGTTSTQDPTKGYPFVALKSFSDGPKNNSSGIPYLYMTDRDKSAMDLLVDKRVSIMASLAQSDVCRTKKYDQQDPRCPKVMITGEYIKVDNSSTEYKFGYDSLVEKHPVMKHWPADHGFYVAKIDPVQIEVLANYGPIKKVKKEDYLGAVITNFMYPSTA